MSSYHILNAIWIGVLPMIIVALCIICLFYFFCCLNRIRMKLREQRYALNDDKQQFKKQQRRSFQIDEMEIDYELQTPIETPVPQFQPKSIIPYNSQSYRNLVKAQKEENRKKKNLKIKSLNDLDNFDIIEVQELNESPKSLFKKYQNNNLNRKASKSTPIANTNKPIKKSTCTKKIEFSSSGDDNSAIFRYVKTSRKRRIDVYDEDDYMFDDINDDSLSSTGVCDELSSKSLHNLTNNDNSTTTKRCSKLNVHKASLDITSLSSMDPDVDIVKNMLVKSNTQINSNK